MTMTNAAHTMQLPRPLRGHQSDPMRTAQQFGFRRIFYPLGFPVEVETNCEAILDAAVESWGEQGPLATGAAPQPVLRVRFGVEPSSSSGCPPTPSFRASGHLLSIIADVENFSVCDLRQGVAFGWLTESTIRHRRYLRYHFLEATVMCLLTGCRVTPVHAAAISLNGCGLLLCGESGAGKSTLAYACARAGFDFTTDDACYVVWNRPTPYVRGNAHQVRFRPSARDLFPEIAGRELTSRAEGKPSIEIRTAELPHIMKAPQTEVNAVILLSRQPTVEATLHPLELDQILPYLDAALYPLDQIRERQAASLRGLHRVARFELRYTDLCSAVACLELLTREMTKQ